MADAVRLAYLLTADAGEAVEMAEDAFVRATGRFAHRVAGDRFPAMLRRQLVRVFLARARRNGAAQGRGRSDAEPREDGTWKAVLSLPPRERVAVVLRYGLDFTEEDVAHALACSLPAARSMVSTARADAEREGMRVAGPRGAVRPSPRLAERIRRRQALTVLLAVVAILAVAAGSIGVAAATLHQERPTVVVPVSAPQGNRTTFLYGIRVSYPRTWSLLQLSGRGDPAPLLQLSSFRPSVLAPSRCGGGSEGVPRRGVTLTVAQRIHPGARFEPWPVAFRPEGRGCFSARWAVHGVSMEASMVVGGRAPIGARRDMLDAFHSLRFPTALSSGADPAHITLASTAPQFVVASGYVAGRPAGYLARREGTRICLQMTVGSDPAGGACRAVQLRGDIEVSGVGPWAGVTGLVSRRTTSVDAVLAGGQTVAGEVVPAPPILGAPFDFFAVELPRRSRGVVVARGTGHRVLDRRRFDPPPLAGLARGGVGDTRWAVFDREQSNGVRCVDFDNGHGDQATLCPTAVPDSRDIQATAVHLLYGRPMVVGVVSDRVAYVQVQYLTPRFAPARIRPFPKAFGGSGAVLPPRYRLFTARVPSIDGAIVVAYDHDSNPIDGMPLEAAQDFGD